jgi:hypothetical protein
MSEATVEYSTRFNPADTVARIKRVQAETHKFVAEHDKLAAKAARLRCDRLLASILAAGALSGFIAAILPLILRSWGIH